MCEHEYIKAYKRQRDPGLSHICPMDTLPNIA